MEQTLRIQRKHLTRSLYTSLYLILQLKNQYLFFILIGLLGIQVSHAQAPTVTGLNPVRNLRNAPTNTNVAVSFSQPMSSGAATLGAMRVFSAQRGGQLRNGVGGSTSASGNTLTFNPTTNFRPGETLFTTITPQAQSTGGNSLTRGQVYQFTTQVGGTGEGNFISPSTNPNPAVGSRPISMALGDVDGDGYLDLLSANFESDNVSVRLNDGTGSFTTSPTNPNPTVGDGPYSVVLGDVDGDGDLDFLTANLYTDNVSVRLNDGTGNFTPPSTSPNTTVGDAPACVVLGDVDGDGDLDFLTANNDNTVSVRLNDGTGRFTAPTTNPNPGVSISPTNVVLGDLDGDGDLDLISCNGSNSVSVRLNDGTGNFTPPSTAPNPTVGTTIRSVVLGDVDGDGDLDLLTANFNSNNVSVRLNNGVGRFNTSPSIPNPAVGNGPTSVVLGDVDGDGDLDLLTANTSGNTVSVRLNNGTGNFTPPTTNPNLGVGSWPYSVVLGDVDEDGDLDFLNVNYINDNVSVRLNGLPPTPTIAGLAASPTVVCVGSPVRFTATVGNVTGTYTYTLSNGETSLTGVASTSAFSQSLTAAGSGPQNFTLTVLSSNLTATTSLTVNSPPSVSIAASPSLTITQGESTTLTASGADTYRWSTGATSEVISATGTGSYSVTGTSGGCSSIASVSVTVNILPPSIADLSATPNPVCVGRLVTFTATVGNVTGSYAYTLTQGSNPLSGTTSTTAFSQTLTASLSGIQNYTLTVKNNDLTTVATTSLTVSSPPSITITALPSAVVFSGQSATLTASGADSYTWSTGETSPAISVSASGVYTVTGTNQAGCTGISFAAVTVIPRPNFPPLARNDTLSGTINTAITGNVLTNDFDLDGNPLVASSIDLPAHGTLLLNSDGSFTYNPNANFIGQDQFTYRACDNATPPLCATATVYLNVQAVAPALAGFTANTGTVCVGSSITFTAQIGNVTGSYNYTLTNGNSNTTGTTSVTAFSQSLVANGSGIQSFTLTVVSNGLSSSATTSVTINNLPIPTLSASSGGTLTCAQSSLTLTAGGGSQYVFGGPGILSQNSISGTAEVNVAGLYSVTVTTSGCSSTTTLTIIQDNNVPSVIITPGSATLSCATSSVSLSAVGSGTYRWSTGALTQAISATSAATYSVTLTAANGCTATASAQVFQDNSVPTVSISPVSAMLTCTTLSVSLSAAGTGTYRWNTGEITQSISATIAGTYSVTLTATNNCTTSASVVVSQDNNSPVVTINPGNATLSCVNPSVSLSAVGSGTYRWSTGATTQVISITAAGTYSVTLTAPNGCTATASIVITQDNSAPTVSISANPSLTITSGQTTTLTANGANSYLWNTNAATSAIVVNASGVYSVTGTTGSCQRVASVTVVQPVSNAPFAITAVTTNTCQQIASNRYVISFTPQYSGLTGQPVSFSVVNELFPTTAPGPYTLQLYDDNSTIILKAQQTGTPGEVSFTYNWLANCQSPQPNTPPRVNQPLTDQTARVGEGFGYTIPQTTFTDNESPHSLVLTISGLPAGLNFSPPTQIGGVPSMSGVSSVTVTATDPQGLSVSTHFLLTVVEPTATNTPPTLVNPIPNQVAIQGQPYGLNVNATFTDAQTPNALTLTASGLPTGLNLVGTTITGTPSLSGTSTITLQATDPGGLSASTQFALLIQPTSVTASAPFAITAVNPLFCTQIANNRYEISFQPRYSGQNGQPLNFWVVNELFPTTAPGPYSLQLYNDNPTIVLKAKQEGSPNEASFTYNWLANCQSPQPNTPPRVNQPLTDQTARVGEGFGYTIPQTTFTDNESPHSLVLTISGLPAGLNFSPPTQIGGVPSMSGVSSVTVTATDPQGLSVSTTFTLTVQPANIPSATFTITGVQTLSCLSVGPNRQSIRFQPQYVGLTGEPVSFSVVNELLPTTLPGPYTLELYNDNATIQLRAQQGNQMASYAYNWLAGCGSPRQGIAERSTDLQVSILGNPIEGEFVDIEIEGALALPLQLSVTNLNGQPLHQTRLENVADKERVRVPITNKGVFLLQVSTPTQRREIRLIKQ
ncbi:hypothetical protein GCM10028807_50790 [Spirosoma daeguense]